MLEQAIQNKIIKHFEAEGWFVIKLIKTNINGIPDLVLTKPDQTVFIEVKRPGGRPSKLQEFRLNQLRHKGFRAGIALSVEQAINIVQG